MERVARIKSYLKELTKPGEIKTEQILKAKTLSSLKRIEGEDFIFDMVIYLLSDLCSFFNVSRPMTANQIAQTGELIIELYEHYKPEDFVLCFRNIKILKYGKFFEGIDGGKIIEMMHLYDIEREESIIKYHADKSNENKYLSKQEYNEAILPVLKSVAEKFENQKPIEKPVRQPSANELKMQSWLKEFDVLYREQLGDSQNTIRMVKYKTKNLTQDEFISLKLEENNNK